MGMELHWSLSKNLLKDRITRIIKFTISIVLLFLILKKMDWLRIIETFKSVNLMLFGCSFIIGYIIQLFLCVFRWQQMLKICCQIQAGYITLLKTYWKSLFIGYFVPAGLGSDLYRITRMAIKGSYGIQITTVIFEKIYIFLADIILVLATYMLVYPLIMPGTNMQEIENVMGGMATAGILFILVLVGLKHVNMVSYIECKLKAYFSKIKNKELSTPSMHGSTLEPFTCFKNIIIFVFLTILIRISISSLGGWCLFASLGVSLPFKVHIFAWSVIYILFKLPISIGSFGVREVSYVILFGFFGVEKEVALTASFLGLACTLGLTLLGGINIKFLSKPNKAN